MPIDRLRTILIAASTVLALTTTSCTSLWAGSPSGPGTSGQVAISSDRASTLRLASGVEVDVPAGAVHGTGTLSGAPTRSPGVAPVGLLLAGKVYDLHVHGATLSAPVTVRLPVPPQAAADGHPAPAAALLAFYDTGAHRWTPVDARYDAAAGTLTARTPHLSLWTVLRVDTGLLTRAVGDAVTGFLGTADTADQPSCPGETQARAAGISVASDKGNLVKWCVGTGSDGGAVLRLANNRHYALETDYPSTWTARRLGPADTLFSSALQAVAHLGSPTPRGISSIIIGGGRSVEFTIPAGSGGQADTLPSVPAYLLSALSFGADTLAMTFGKVPGAPPVDPTKTAKAIGLAFATKGCLSTLDSLLHHDISDAASVGELFRTATDMATGCLADQWEIAYGLTGFVAQFAVGVILWLVEGIKLVIDGVQAALDTVLYFRDYRTNVHMSPVAVPVVGLVWAPYQEGWGTVRPTRVFNGGDPTGLMTGIVWLTYGGPTATGTGQAEWVAPNASVADGTIESARIVASGLGTCLGKLAYLKVGWYFPRHGETPADVYSYDFCKEATSWNVQQSTGPH